MTYTKKPHLLVLPPLSLKKKKSASKPKPKSKTRSKSPKNGNGRANGHAMAFNNQNMPPNNPQLSRGTRFTP